MLVARIVVNFSAGGREEGRAGFGGKRCCGRGVGRCGEEKSVGYCMSRGLMVSIVLALRGVRRIHTKIEDRLYGRIPIIESKKLLIEGIDARADRILAGQG